MRAVSQQLVQRLNLSKADKLGKALITTMDVSGLEKALHYNFNNTLLLSLALSHSSYANESNNPNFVSNQRLEFLGDSVLSIVCTEYLYTHFTEHDEGELTRIRAAVVCEASLYEIASSLNLGAYLFLGKGEERGGGRTRVSILADATEAVFGAVFLDGGLEGARQVILHFIPALADNARRGALHQDYKTILQEIVQKNHGELLSYRLIGSDGPDHKKEFFVAAFLNSNQLAVGRGKSKKEAEQQAAKEALSLMGQV